MSDNTTALVIGDPHFKVNNVRDTDLMCKAIIEVVKDKRPDFAVVLGDTLDRHETIHVTPLTRAISFLSDLSTLVPVYLLIGNHDLINNSQFLSDQHPFNSLKKWANLTVADKTLSKTIKGHTFTFVPYVPPGRFASALGDLSKEGKEGKDTDNKSQPTAIFCHQEFKGAKMGAVVSTIGDVWPPENCMVVSGHIHDYDRLADNILYTGTPIQHGFGDTSRKTVSFLTFKHGSGENDIKALMHEERIDLAVPRKIVLHLNASDVDAYEMKENGSEIKVVISGFSAALSTVMKSVKIQSWIKRGIKVTYKHMTEMIMGTNPSSAKAKYATILYQMCAKDEALKSLYEEIVGKPAVVGVVRPRLVLK